MLVHNINVPICRGKACIILDKYYFFVSTSLTVVEKEVVMIEDDSVDKEVSNDDIDNVEATVFEVVEARVDVKVVCGVVVSVVDEKEATAVEVERAWR